MSPDEYRRAVKLTMKKKERRGGSWVDVSPTDEDVNFLLLKAAEYGLNPLKGQIYATWRGGKIQVETTLDGLRVLAERTGAYRGQTKPEWYDGEQWTDVWIDDRETPVAARVGIRRKGFPEPLFVTVHWREFKQTNNNGELAAMWQEKPAHMLAKTSASLGFRAAFPGEAGGIYTAEEMAVIGQAGSTEGGGAQPPAAASGSNGSAPAGNGSGPPARQAQPRPGASGANGDAPAAIVDPPAQQPSGPPATPATSSRLAAVLEKAGYSRLREDLAKLVFAQQASRLNEEQTARLANALTAAEAAGITAVELERACKVGLKDNNVQLRRRALFEWIAERAAKAGQAIPDRRAQTNGSQAPAGDSNGQASAASQIPAEPGTDEVEGQGTKSDEEGGTETATVSGTAPQSAADEGSAAEPTSSPATDAASPEADDTPLPAPDADGGAAVVVDSEPEEEPA
jgi:phage recombination protein Bet